MAPPTVMSYAQLSLLELDASDFTCDGLPIEPWLSDLIEPVLMDAITPPITDALNSLLNDYIPFPASCSP